MADNGHLGIFCSHSRAVIRHTDVSHTAVCNFYFHFMSACIDRIFHQLFDDIDRTLDDFSCSNLIRRNFIKNMN